MGCITKIVLISSFILTPFFFGCNKDHFKNKSLDKCKNSSSDEEYDFCDDDNDPNDNKENSIKQTEFALKFFKTLSNSDKWKNKNIILASAALSNELFMTFEGASGQTKEEIQKYGGIPKYKEVRTTLFPSSANGSYQSANAFFYPSGFPISRSYLDILNKDYQAQVEKFSSTDSTEKSNQIDAWVNKKVNSKTLVSNLISPENLKDNAAALLMSYATFKADWEIPFEENKNQTEDKDIFTKEDGTTVSPSFMYRYNDDDRWDFDKLVKYQEDEFLETIKLNYMGGAYFMLIFLPRKDKKIKEIREKLSDFTYYDQVLNDDLKFARIKNFSMPKFSFTSFISSKETLEEMGIKFAFDPQNADFSALHQKGKKVIHISNFFQEAQIEVNEKGTTAGIASEKPDVMRGEAPEVFELESLHINRPFIYSIMRSKDYEIMFMGQVMDPTQES